MPTTTPRGRRLTTALFGWLLGLLLGLPGGAAARPVPKRSTPPGTVTLAAPRWQFVANRGQWPAAVRYAVDLPAGRLYLEQNRLTHALYDAATAAELQHHPERAADARVKAHAYTVSFEGAAPQPELQASGPASTRRNYYLGNDPQHWATDVPAFAELRYQQLHPGISLRLYSRPAALEYDFELAAGADPSLIRLRYDGASSLRIGTDGSLRIGTSVGQVLEQRPVAYQLIDGQRREVACAFRLDGARVTFVLPRGYDRQRPLVIDPVLVYATYSGSTANNYGYAGTYDSQGHQYAAGVDFGPGFPVTTGAYDVSYNGLGDLSILKFDPAASGPASLLYATYLGGNGEERPISLIADQQDNLLLLGLTEDGTFPTTPGAYDTSFNGGRDLVLCKLSATGNALLAATFVGGSGEDGLNSSVLSRAQGDSYRGEVQVDALGRVYICTTTASTDFPAPGGFQTSLRGPSDAVVARLTSTLNRLEWASYLGGTGADAGYALQLDGTGNVFVGGSTNSADLPGTAGALLPTAPGNKDGFVASLSADGQTLHRSTYLGTSRDEQAYRLQLDADGVYVVGSTEGSYPTTPGAYAAPAGTLFVHKLDYALTTTRFAATLGGPGSLTPTAFGIDHCGRILIAAFGGSIGGLPITPDAFQTTATSSFYLVQLAPNAARLLYASFFGQDAPHTDGGHSRFSPRGQLYQTMCVTGGVPVTATAYAGVIGSGSINSFSIAAFKLDMEPLRADFVQSDTPLGPRIRGGCAPVLVYFRPLSRAATVYRWTFGDGTTATQAVPPPHLYSQPGRYVVTLTVADTTGCLPSRTAVDSLEILAVPTVLAGPDRRICPGGAVQLIATVSGPTDLTYSWSPGLGLSSISSPTVTAAPTTTTTYVLTVATPRGCFQRDTVQVQVLAAPHIRVDHPGQAFTGQVVTFANASQDAVTYHWDFGDGQSSTEASPTHTFTAPGRFRVQLRATSADDCPAERSFEVDVRRFELPNVITPNGDGQNDTFRPFVSFAPIDLEVYNRWGRKVYAQPGYAGSWAADGLPAGVYYYRLRVGSGETWKGWIEVMR